MQVGGRRKEDVNTEKRDDGGVGSGPFLNFPSPPPFSDHRNYGDPSADKRPETRTHGSLLLTVT